MSVIPSLNIKHSDCEADLLFVLRLTVLMIKVRCLGYGLNVVLCEYIYYLFSSVSEEEVNQLLYIMKL
jgi:hypothetical protein